MPEIEFSDPVKKADQWAWVVSTLVTMALFFIGAFFVGEVLFSAIVAAAAGIGVQFLLPYLASMMVPAEERVSIEDHPSASNYHHGAVGAALIIASLSAFGVMFARPDSNVGLWAGGIVFAVSYFALSSILPRR